MIQLVMSIMFKHQATLNNVNANNPSWSIITIPIITPSLEVVTLSFLVLFLTWKVFVFTLASSFFVLEPTSKVRYEPRPFQSKVYKFTIIKRKRHFDNKTLFGSNWCKDSLCQDLPTMKNRLVSDYRISSNYCPI